MIGMLGHGFVGSAYSKVLSEAHELFIVDPAQNDNHLMDRDDYAGIVVCLPTPQGADGECDYSILLEGMDTIPPDVPVLIKSTISFEAWDMVTSRYSNPITFSPEFLRQDHADKDLQSRHYMLFAGGNEDHWVKIMKACPTFAYKVFSIYQCPKDLILAKYTINSFLALKVAFFNQVFDFCKANEIDYDTVKNMVSTDPRIGSSHMVVTEERGFGGACFPKDTSALLEMDENKYLTILNECVEYNQALRKE